MKKMWKKVIAALLVITLGIGTFIAASGNTALAGENATDGLSVIGASIRFINENTTVDGIRFAVGVKADAFNQMTDAQKKNYHLLVMPTALVKGELEKGETYTYMVDGTEKYAKAQDISIDWTNATTENGYKVVRIYLNEIDNSYYTIGITARAYYQDGGNVVYSEAIERSYYSVAEAALDDLSDTKVDGTYANKAGSKYSPYDAKQRDALLGVKYEKIGMWDLQDGNLITNGSTKTEANTYIHPMVLDRATGINSSNYVIETSFDVGVSNDAVFVGQADNSDTSMKGFVFAYDEAAKSYYLLDFRYRAPANATEGWYPYIRYYNGSGWGTTIGKGSPIDAGWSDFRIAVNATGATTEISVEYKKQGEDIYTTIINSRSADTGSWADGTTITGSKVGFYTTLPDQTLEFDSDVKVSNNTVQTRGNSSVKLDQKLAEDGTGTIRGSFVVDYRIKGNNSRREGIKFSGTDGNGYYFWVGAQPEFTTPRFYIGMWRNTGTGSAVNWNNTDMSNGASVVPYREAANAGVTLLDNDEILVDYEIIISITSDNKKAFSIKYTLSYDAWSYSGGWNLTDNRVGQYFTDGDVYLYSEDTGNENITDDIGDGKTIYYPITVNGNEAKPGEPKNGTTTVMQTNGAQSLKLNQALNADGTGTVKGQFIVDYRTKGNNSRKEGIKFSGTDGNGYYFWVGAQPEFTTPRFYIGMWRNTGTGSAINWNNTDMSNGASVVPYREATNAGITLSDNDEIIVDFEITISITNDNKKAFSIKYTLSHDTWSYSGGWDLTDNRVGQYFTGGDVYLCSEDAGDPNVTDDVGDGKTVYNWITVNDNKASLLK